MSHESEQRAVPMADEIAVSRAEADRPVPAETGDPPATPAAEPPASITSGSSSGDVEPLGVESETTLGLSRSDVRFAVVCGGLILLLLLAHWAKQSLFGARLVEIDRLPVKAYEFRLDINSATWVEWMQLEGVGEVLARRIVADRAAHGPFADIDDVRRVPGVGPKTLEAIRPHLFCSDCPLSGNSP